MPTQMSMVVDIARGLQHLAGFGISVNDLGTRNCLLGADLVASVGTSLNSVDAFGEDYYSRSRAHPLLPVRWLAPEVLQAAGKNAVGWPYPTAGSALSKVLGQMSDVFAFGVTVWELGTSAELP